MNVRAGVRDTPTEVRPTRDGWRLLFDQIRRQRRGIALGVLVGLLWTAGKVSVPRLVQIAVDRGIESGDLGSLAVWSVAIAAAGVVAAVFTGLRRYLAFREARRAEAELRDRIFAHIQRLHFAYHDRTQTGQLMSRANTDLQQFQNFITMIPITLANAATLVAVVVILVTINPLLTLLALGPLPLVNVLGKRFSTRLFPAVLAVQQESAELAEVVEESVAGVRIIKGFGAERLQARRLAAEADDVYEQSMRAARVRATYLPLIELLPNVGLIAVLGYGGHQVLAGELSVGELIAFNAYVVMLVAPLRMLGMIVAQAQRASAAGQRIHEVLATAPRITSKRNARRLPTTDEVIGGRLGEVRFEDVEFGYHPDGPPVLWDFNLVIPAGSSVALVGPTGCGKTTVARLIPRFYDVDRGAVLVDGVDVRDLDLRELRRAVGIVFEDTFLFSDTIRANIAFADPDAPLERIERAARLAGAHEFIRRLPEGYDTEIGERGFSLSGGQRQRIAIARAILADPRILILDDATSSVDPSKEHEIRDALREVMAGRTTIVIAHRPATIALADRVVLLDEGRVVAEGTHDELLLTCPRYRAVLAEAEAAETLAAASSGAGDPSGTPPGADTGGGR